MVSSWRAESAQDLAQAGGVIADSWFDVNDVVHDEDTRTLTLRFAQDWDWSPIRDEAEWADAPRPEPIRRTWRYREEHVSFMRGTLHIGTVDAVDTDPTFGDSAMLLRVDYDDDDDAGILTVRSVSGNLNARVERVDVSIELVNDVALLVRRRHGFFGGISEMPLWDLKT